MLFDRGVLFRGRWYPPIAGGAPDGDDPPANPGQTPPAGGQTPPAPPATPPAGQEPTRVFDAEYVAELRKEAAANRKKAADLEAKLKEQDDAKLSETEKLAKRASDAESRATALEAQMHVATVRMEVERQARRLNVVDEEAAYVLMDKDGLDTAADDFGKSVERRLKSLVEAKPWLVQQQNGHAPAGPSPTPKGGGAPSKEDYANNLYERMRQGYFPRL